MGSSRSARAAVLAGVGLLLLGLAGGLFEIQREAGPAAGEATAAGMVGSLWHDRDLRFDHWDLDRAFRLWNQGPQGLELTQGRVPEEAPRYAGSLVYPLAAVPAYALFGPRGLLLFNAALYLLLFAVGVRLLGVGGGWGQLAAAAFFFASAAAGWIFRLGPDVLLMVCAFLPLAMAQLIPQDRPARWWEGAGWGLAGILAAAGALSEPLLALFAVPVLVDLAGRRRPHPLALFAAGALSTAALLIAVGWGLTGSPLPDRASPRGVFHEHFPVGGEVGPAWREAALGAAAGGVPIGEPPMRAGLSGLGWFLLGRDGGLVPYFPFALFALAAGLTPGGSHRRQLLFGVVVLYGLAVFLLPAPGASGPPVDGRLAAGYPVLALLLAGRRFRWSLLLPLSAAALWTLPALSQVVVAPGAEVPVQQGAAFQLLPLELDRLAAGDLAGYAGRPWGGSWWIVPRAAFFVGEENPAGVWVRGATDSQVVVVTPAPVEAVSFRAHSLAGADNRLRVTSSVGTVTVLFDSLAKQQGSLVSLPLEPVARAPARGGGTIFYSTFRLAVTGGEVAARHYPGSGDRRYLGVFLDFTGSGP